MSARHNIWPFGAGQPLGSRTTHHRRTASRGVSAKAAQREARERESERLESKLSASDLNKRLERHYARGGTLSEFFQANPALHPVNPGKGSFARCVAAVSKRGDVDDPNAVCAASKRRTAKGARELQRVALAGRKRAAGGKARKNVFDPSVGAYLGSELSKFGAKLQKKSGRNPAEAAAEMYEKFHGRPSAEVVEIEKRVHYHEHLSGLGELEKLTVRANDGALVDIEGFKGAILASNETGTQLYIEGGNQAVNLSAFGIGKPYHDLEDLGEGVKIWYYTTKLHLGKEGGEASYHHKFSEEKKVRMEYVFGQSRAPKPRVVYDTMNRALGFIGGEYTVEPEGIRN